MGQKEESVGSENKSAKMVQQCCNLFVQWKLGQDLIMTLGGPCFLKPLAVTVDAWPLDVAFGLSRSCPWMTMTLECVYAF
jgi:hypothetical protein